MATLGFRAQAAPLIAPRWQFFRWSSTTFNFTLTNVRVTHCCCQPSGKNFFPQVFQSALSIISCRDFSKLKFVGNNNSAPPPPLANCSIIKCNQNRLVHLQSKQTRALQWFAAIREKEAKEVHIWGVSQSAFNWNCSGAECIEQQECSKISKLSLC